MGVYYSEIKKIPGKTYKDKLKTLNINVGPKITMKEAMKLLKKRIRN